MTERLTERLTDRSHQQDRGKHFAQDALGFLFCGIGGFFAVSIVLFARGGSPKPGAISTLTWPVVELVTQIGYTGAVVFSLGLAALGTALFLRPVATASLRPLLALLAFSLAAALVLGGFGAGGELGAWLPGLLTGVVGRVLSVVLGAALSWLGWTLVAGERSFRTSPREAMQRLGLSARHDAGTGISSAEAALLTDARPTAPAHSPRPEPTRPLGGSAAKATPASTRREEPKPVERKPKFEDAVRPLGASKAPAKNEGATRASRPEVLPLPKKVVPFESEPAALLARDETGLPVLPPPAPSWEAPEDAPEEFRAQLPREADADPFVLDAAETFPPSLAPPRPSFEADEFDGEFDGEFDDEDDAFAEAEETLEDELEPEPASTLAGELAAAFEDEEFLAEEPEPRAPETNEPEAQFSAAAEPLVAAPAWEQVGLFDEPEEEELEEQVTAARAEPVELTPSFDFEAPAVARTAHEPEPGDDPFAEAVTPEPLAPPPIRPTPTQATPIQAHSPAPAAPKEKPPAPAPAKPLAEGEPELPEREIEAKPPRKRARKSTSPEAEPEAQDFLLQPAPARAAPPVAAADAPSAGTGDEESERWSQLVFEAGCAILEQKRVAVSMLERRFGIDFDQACLVLDGLQQAGLIGPYLGGRTREILLDTEAWMARAPHAPESL